MRKAPFLFYIFYYFFIPDALMGGMLIDNINSFSIFSDDIGSVPVVVFSGKGCLSVAGTVYLESNLLDGAAVCRWEVVVSG